MPPLYVEVRLYTTARIEIVARLYMIAPLYAIARLYLPTCVRTHLHARLVDAHARLSACPYTGQHRIGGLSGSEGVMAYMVMAYMVMVYIVMAYVVMAYIVWPM